MLKYSKYEWGYKLLIVYIYTLLFSSSIMKMVGVPSSVGLPLIAVLDIMPLAFWFLLNPSFRIKTKEVFVDTFKFWFLWLVVLIFLLIAANRHGGSLIPSLVHWGALVRYMPLAYIIVEIGKHIEIEDRIIKQFGILAIILILIGYLCIIAGDNATIFLPLLPENATGERETLEGNYSAIFANTIDYAFILVLFYSIFAHRQGLNKFKTAVLTLLFFVVIFKTGSAIGTTVFSCIAFFRLTQDNNSVRYSMIALLVVAICILGYIYWDLVMLVVENAMLSRLGILTLTAPDFLSELSCDTFWGIGNDGYVVLDKINGYKDQVWMLAAAKDGDISAFGDVYWVSLLVFHGLIGLVIICYIYYSLYKAVNKKSYIDSRFNYSKIINCFFVSIIIFAFLNQVIVVKTFALVFWVFLAIVYNKIQHNEDTSNK